MNNVLMNKSISAIMLIIIGIIGYLFSPLALFIAAIAVIAFGIYNIYKRIWDTGIIIICVGIGILIISRFLNHIIQFISIGCIILGIVLFLVYFFSRNKN